MNEPEQNQPIIPDKGHEEAGAVPVPSSSTASAGVSNGQPITTRGDRPAQPEYGQRSQPEYGAMSDQYPANYNPYVYGAPEPPKPKDEQPSSSAQRNPHARPEERQANPYAAPGQQKTGQNLGTPYQYGPNAYQQPGMYPINLDDPRQNPLYGHWDSYAILSLIFALLMPIPVVPAIMGAIAMWRTKKLHMKGYALGVAALIVNVLYTIGVVWMAVHGISTSDLYNQMLQYLFGGAGQGGDSSSISA